MLTDQTFYLNNLSKCKITYDEIRSHSVAICGRSQVARRRDNNERSIVCDTCASGNGDTCGQDGVIQHLPVHLSLF